MDDEPLSENLFVRMPAGTKARIEAARGFEPQSAWLRRVILAALPDKPAEKRKRPIARRRA